MSTKKEMNKIKILADSCNDLSEEQKKANDISILPLVVTLGEDSYLDGESIFPKDIYKYAEQTKILPKTAARSIEDFKKFFSYHLKTNSYIIYFSISSELSVSYSNACKARDEIAKDRIFVVDSKSLSTGIGLLILKACELRNAGFFADEIYEEILKTVPYVQASFVVTQMDYLYKGGRCSRMQYYGANILGIKPRLQLLKGEIINTAKYLGSQISVYKKYIDQMLKKYPPNSKIAFITHACADNTLAMQMQEYVINKNIFENVFVTVAGATISSHCGEGTLGILYISKEKIV